MILIFCIIILGLVPNLVLDLLQISHFLLLEKLKF